MSQPPCHNEPSSGVVWVGRTPLRPPTRKGRVVTQATTGVAVGRDTVTDRVSAWVEQRPGPRDLLGGWRDHALPDQWARRFAHIAVSSFVVCLASGVLLALVYDPLTEPVRYEGSYAPLRGVEMSSALASTLELSFDVRGGLLMRQLHHWSASLMIAALLLLILRVFFVGGFRGPRRLTWAVLFLVLFASMGAGLTGAVLPDDLVSGSSLAVLDGLLKSVPVVGTSLSALVFQGRFPSGAVGTFYPLHVFVLPAAIVGLVSAAVVLGARSARRQNGAPRRRARSRARRRATSLNALGLFLVVAALETAMAALVTVNPVWQYGPADPGNASAGAGALWYLAFLDGAQRLAPPGWELVWADRTWTFALLVPIGVSTAYLGLAMLYPWLEARVTGDRGPHRLPTRPRNAPTRTGIGVAGMAFYGVLWAAGGSDVIATRLGMSLEDLVRTLQVGLLLFPVLGFVTARWICLGLQHRDRETLEHGVESGRIVRLPSGGFVEVHRPVEDDDRPRYLGPGDEIPQVSYRPTPL